MAPPALILVELRALERNFAENEVKLTVCIALPAEMECAGHLVGITISREGGQAGYVDFEGGVSREGSLAISGRPAATGPELAPSGA